MLPDYDHNPDTVDILLFDNGISRDSMGEKIPAEKRYTRLVHYRVDEKAKTVEQLWQYGKERPELYARTLGNVQLLENGNIYASFAREGHSVPKKKSPPVIKDTVYLEVNRQGEVIWECLGRSFDNSIRYGEYRAERWPLYNKDMDYSTLMQEPQNFVPKEVM